MRPFDERELELVIGGISSIDVNDWKTHTRLKHCTADSVQVQWFWQVIRQIQSPAMYYVTRVVCPTKFLEQRD